MTALSANPARRDSQKLPAAPPSVLLVSAAFFFAAMAVIAKGAARNLPGPEVAFVRFCFGLLACVAASSRVPFRTNNKRGLFWRGAYGGAAVLLYFLAIAHLPVGLATLLNYTAPVFTAVYSAAFLGETIGPSTLGALAVTSAGLLLVIKGNAPEGSLGIGIWQVVGIGSAMLSGAAIATIREVRRTDGSWEIFAAFCIGGAVITLPGALSHWVPPSRAEWAALAGVGALAVVGQLALTYSLRYVSATVAAVVIQLTPIVAMSMGWIFLDERFSGLTLVGALVTLSGASWGASIGQRRANGALPA